MEILLKVDDVEELADKHFVSDGVLSLIHSNSLLGVDVVLILVIQESNILQLFELEVGSGSSHILFKMVSSVFSTSFTDWKDPINYKEYIILSGLQFTIPISFMATKRTYWLLVTL